MDYTALDCIEVVSTSYHLGYNFFELDDVQFAFVLIRVVCFFFQAEDGIRDIGVTGVQTCALPISLVETPYFVLRSDRLRLPDGAVKDPYFILERPDAAIIFPLTSDGDVILVRQYRPAIERMELGLPAGLVEEGEEPEKAARRELQEETGYAGGEWEPLGALASSPSLKDNWAYLFLARGVEETDPPDPDEHELVETMKAPVEGLPGLIRSGEIVSSSGVEIGR